MSSPSPVEEEEDEEEQEEEMKYITCLVSVTSQCRIRICRKVNFSRPWDAQSFGPFISCLKIVKTKQCIKFDCSRMHILGASTRRLRFFLAHESSMESGPSQVQRDFDFVRSLIMVPFATCTR